MSLAQDASRMDHGRDGTSIALMPAAPPRFSISHPPDSSGIVQIDGAELRHMRTVLRLKENARVLVLDPAGVEHRGVIERYERDRAVIRIESSTAAPTRTRIILAAAIIKGPRMDFIVEKAAELGASELWPLICSRGLVRSPGAERLARWRRLALGAAKQSGSPPMEVRAAIGIDDLIRGVPSGTLAIRCTQGAQPLAEVIRRVRPLGILIAVGPEGDFDDDECAITASAGFVAAGLGRNRLRSETAALAAVSIATGLLHDDQGSGEDAETK
jgi:16S rRNA (uracil1498-N3)-methyltransferase